MASCVLSGLNSLAGSVCLLWPGETEDGDVMGLMKGVVPTTDILLISTQLCELRWSAALCSWVLSDARKAQLTCPRAARSRL